jgi:hypothetical protein
MKSSFLKGLVTAAILATAPLSGLEGCAAPQITNAPAKTGNSVETENPCDNIMVACVKTKQDLLHALGTDAEKVVHEADGTYTVVACAKSISGTHDDNVLLTDVKADRMLNDAVCKNDPRHKHNAAIGKIETVQSSENKTEMCVKKNAAAKCDI